MPTSASPVASDAVHHPGAALLQGLARLAGVPTATAAQAAETAVDLVAHGLGVPVALCLRRQGANEPPVAIAHRGDWHASWVGAAVEAIAAATLDIEPPAPLLVEDVAADPRWSAAGGGWGPRAFAAAPVVRPDGHPLGLLCGLDDRPRPFSPDQANALAVAAALLGEVLAWEAPAPGAPGAQGAPPPNGVDRRLGPADRRHPSNPRSGHGHGHDSGHDSGQDHSHDHGHNDDPAGRIGGRAEMPTALTDPRRTEDAAVAERDLLQTIIDAVPDFIHLKAADGTYRLMNAAWAAALGLPDAAAGVGSRSADFFSPARTAELEAEDAAVLTTGEPLLNVLSRAERSAEERWVLRSKLPLRDDRGHVVGTVGIVRDVTERKRAEDALATERDLLQTLLDTIPDPVFVKDRTGAIVRMNRAFAEENGIADPAASIGKTADAFLPADYLAEYARTEPGIIETGQPVLNVLERYEEDGQVRWYLMSKAAWRGAAGEVVGLLGTYRDISPLREAEAALARERDLLQAILDAVPANVYLKDAAGRYLRVNRAAARHLGWADPAAAIGRTVEDLWPARWAAEFRREDAAVLIDGAHLTRQVASTLPDGTARHYLYTKVPVRGGSGSGSGSGNASDSDSGEIVGTLTVSTDVTVMKETEHRLAEALAKEQATTAELETLSRAKSGFLAMLTHEFRTPLTAIQGYADLIHDPRFALSPDEVREYAGEIAGSALRLTRLTSDLLELDRIQAQRVALVLAPTDLGGLAREVVNLLRSAPGDHDFLVDLDRALPPIVADADRLAQVVTNLVGNAIKYSPDGGRVTLRLRRDGDDVLLSVGDQGIGIPEDLLERVFEPYVRAAAAGETGIVGTGLGLPIARELVALHGGRIWAESRPGAGATLTVRLPIAGPDGGDRV